MWNSIRPFPLIFWSTVIMKAHPPSAMVQCNSISPIQSLDDYRRVYTQSQNDHNSFWLHQSKDLVHWSKPPTIGLEGDLYFQ